MQLNVLYRRKQHSFCAYHSHIHVRSDRHVTCSKWWQDYVISEILAAMGEVYYYTQNTWKTNLGH